MINVYKTIISKLALFRKDTSGQISIIIGVILIPFSVFLGAGIDWSQKVSTAAKMQSTIDSAILAVARELSIEKDLTEAEMDKIAGAIFDANISVSSAVNLEELKVTFANDLLKITQVGAVDTSFLNLININKMKVSVSSEVNMKFSGVDLALAVDLSGSMWGNKLKELKKATKLLITELSDTNVTDMRVSFVPWTRGVNLGSYGGSLGGSVSYNYSYPNHKYTYNSKKYYTDRNGLNINNCIQPRGDGKISSTNPTGNHSYDAYCPSAKLIPLTSLNKKTDENDSNSEYGKDVLGDIADSWQARGGTGSHNGMYWAWATLNNSFDTIFGVPEVDDPESVKKYAVIMTDGLNNGYNYGQTFNNKMLAACTAMKQKGISIYAIVLMESSSTVINTFKACASPDIGGRKFFIKTNSASELSDDFKTIAEEIGQFYLSK
ncbi:MAG: pilus assembly protein TadG-related protein [Hyphomicrobiales bacterium]